MRHFPTALLVIVALSALLILPAAAVTNVLVNDTWKDGNDTEPAAPQYAENNGFNGNDADADGDIESVWFQGGVGTLNPVGANGPLRGDITALVNSASWTTYLTPESTPVNLAAEGDALKLTWVFTPTGVNMSNTNQGVRMALVNSPGDSRVTANASPANAAYRGYAMLMNFGQTFDRSNPFQLTRRNVDSGNLLSSAGNWTDLGTTGAARNTEGFLDATEYTFTWEITRNATNGLDHIVRMAGGNIDNDGLAEVIFTDETVTNPDDPNSAPFGSFTFDTFQIRPGGGGTGASNAISADIFDTSLFMVEYTTSSEPPVLLGDFNGDNKVDAADYVVWRKTIGTQEKYDEWRMNFGATAGAAAGASLSVAAVPEPTTAIIVIAATLALSAFRRSR